MKNNDALDGLIDRILEATDSVRNREKNKNQIHVNIEAPIGWIELFGYDIDRFFSDPVFYAEQYCRQELWRYNNIEDDVPIRPVIPAFLGYYPEYTFLGIDVVYNQKGVPILSENHPLTREPDLSLLMEVDFDRSGWMPRAKAWYEQIQEIAGDRLSVEFIQWGRGCLDLAVQLRGYHNLVMDTLERPAFVHQLMSSLVEQRNRWYSRRAEYTGEKIQSASLADDWINVPFISPQIFRDFVLPCYKNIEAFHGGITGIHSCGNQEPVQQYLLELKTMNQLEVSPWTDLLKTLVNVPDTKHLYINFHPNDILFASKQDMENKLRFTVEACQGRGYTLCTAGLTPVVGSNEAFMEKIRMWTRTAREMIHRHS